MLKHNTKRHVKPSKYQVKELRIVLKHKNKVFKKNLIKTLLILQSFGYQYFFFKKNIYTGDIVLSAVPLWIAVNDCDHLGNQVIHSVAITLRFLSEQGYEQDFYPAFPFVIKNFLNETYKYKFKILFDL